uniref:Alpha-amylase n=1 Tax=Physcomitrium patens TaxID=3218 RepID=A0A2K1J2B9_PHYPA|nr:hypothetical protein PHYPA_021525 [Physcomitrium patens]
MPGPGWNRSVSPGRIICSRRSGTRSGAVASLFTSDGQERFYNKELHKRQFEYHRGGRMRPARPVPVDNSNIILFQVVCQFRPLDHNRAIRLIPSGTKPISVKSPEKCEAGFDWESHNHNPSWWIHFQSKIEDLFELGITDVWLPPASQSVDKKGYLPGQLYNLDSSRYGKGIELRNLLDVLHMHGMCGIADIVINHRTAGTQDKQGHWNIFDGGVPDKRLAWGAWAVVDNDVYNSGGKGKHDTGESYGAAPDLDHTSKRVQDELTDWMNWLRAEVGFDGWRFDFAKGYGPQYCGLYCERTCPSFAVGEIWTSMSYKDSSLLADQDAHRQKLCDWIDGTGGRVCAFDFTTKGILQTAVEGQLWRLQDSFGKPPGLIGWWPQKAVTFVDNHDTGSTQRHWSFPDDKIAMGYAYILTHPGIPCIFYDHYFNTHLKFQIKELVQVRLRNHINTESKVSIKIAEADIYVASIADRVLVKLGPRMDMGLLLPNERFWKLATSGENYAIWESTTPPTTTMELPIQTHEDVKLDHKSVPNNLPIKVRLVNTMSTKTKKRILEEYPELLDTNIEPTKEFSFEAPHNEENFI